MAKRRDTDNDRQRRLWVEADRTRGKPGGGACTANGTAQAGSRILSWCGWCGAPARKVAVSQVLLIQVRLALERPKPKCPARGVSTGMSCVVLRAYSECGKYNHGENV